MPVFDGLGVLGGHGSSFRASVSGEPVIFFLQDLGGALVLRGVNHFSMLAGLKVGSRLGHVQRLRIEDYPAAVQF